MTGYISSKWNKLNNVEIMGSETAQKASDLSTFFSSLEWIDYDTYVTNNFSDYIASLLRTFLMCSQLYVDISILTTFDLHTITMTGYAINEFDAWLSEKWESYFNFYRENA